MKLVLNIAQKIKKWYVYERYNKDKYLVGLSWISSSIFLQVFFCQCVCKQPWVTSGHFDDEKGF